MVPKVSIRVIAKHVDNTKALWQVSDEQFESFVENCETWFELAAKCGCKSLHPTRVSIDYKPLKKRAQLLQLKIEHFCRKNNQYGRSRVSSMRLKGRRNARDLRKMLTKAGREYICEFCKCTGMQLRDKEWFWMQKKLTLQVDHIGGRNCQNPDALENLRYLCPNCHAQTSNWGGTNKGNIAYILN